MHQGIVTLFELCVCFFFLQVNFAVVLDDQCVIVFNFLIADVFVLGIFLDPIFLLLCYVSSELLLRMDAIPAEVCLDPC